MSELLRYPLDYTGANPNNRVVGEEIDIGSMLKRRIATPKYGPFFTHNLVIRDKSTGRILIKGVDYNIAEILPEAIKDIAKEVAEIIVVEDTTVSNVILVDYSVVGGHFQNSASTIVNIYNTLLNDPRPIDWENVTNKWSEYPPTLHKHLLKEIIGFEPIVVALERIKSAILLGNTPSYIRLMNWVEETTNTLENTLVVLGEDISKLLREHMEDTENPHNLAALLKDSYSAAEIDERIYLSKEMVGDKFRQLSKELTEHIRVPNAHGMIPADIGAPTIAEMNDAISNALAALDLSSQLTEHISNPNAHNTKPSDIGAPTISEMHDAINAAIGNVDISDLLNAHASNPNAHNTKPSDIGAPTIAEMNTAVAAVDNRLTNHINNPNGHNTKPSDIGAPTIAEMNSAIAAVDNKLNIHINNPNGHNTKPSDIGAPTIAEMNTAVNGAKTEASNALAAHTQLRNPHNTRASDVGAPTVAEMNAAIATANNTRLALAGGTMAGPIVGSTTSLAMVQGNNSANGSFTAKSTGTGDNNCAGITLHNSSYGIKIGVRSDGTIGWGGWSSQAWRFYQSGNGDVTATGDITAYSDERLKEDFKELGNVKDIITSLKPYKFKWNNLDINTGKIGMSDIGFKAQDVENLIPEIVKNSIEYEGVVYKTVAYQKLTPILVKAVQELYIENNSIREELSDLKRELELIKKHIDS